MDLLSLSPEGREWSSCLFALRVARGRGWCGRFLEDRIPKGLGKGT